MHKEKYVEVAVNYNQEVPKWGFLLTVTAFAISLGVAVPVGYNIGVMNSPATYIQEWCNETLIKRYDLHLGAELSTLWSFIISIYLVGGCIGSLFCGTVADKFGRKGGLLFCAILAAIGAVLFYFCRILDFVELMILGRFLNGFSGGMATGVTGMYLAEIAPSELRGSIAVFYSLGCTLGTPIAQILTLEGALGTREYWHYALSLYLLLIVVCFLPYGWFPESPKYLYIVANKRNEARKELMRLRNGIRKGDLVTHVNSELAAMEHEATTQSETRSMWSVLTDPCLLLPVVLLVALQGGQQLSGISGVFYYSGKVFEKMGLSETTAKWGNLGTGLINLLVSFSGPKVMEKINRRPVIIFSLFFSGLSLLVLTFSLHFIDAMSVLPIICGVSLFAYVAFFQFGLGPMPTFIGSELFETSARPAAMGIGALASWLGNFCVGMTFLPLKNAIGAFAFLPSAIVCFLVTALIYRYLPETRGREAAEVAPLISNGFRSKVTRK